MTVGTVLTVIFFPSINCAQLNESTGTCPQVTHIPVPYSLSRQSAIPTPDDSGGSRCHLFNKKMTVGTVLTVIFFPSINCAQLNESIGTCPRVTNIPVPYSPSRQSAIPTPDDSGGSRCHLFNKKMTVGTVLTVIFFPSINCAQPNESTGTCPRVTHIPVPYSLPGSQPSLFPMTVGRFSLSSSQQKDDSGDGSHCHLFPVNQLRTTE